MEQENTNVNLIMFKSHRPYNFVFIKNNQKIKVHVRYNSYNDSYYLNIDKYDNGRYKNILNSITLTTGVDLFMMHPQFNLGSLYLIPLKKEYYDKIPSADSIKDNFALMWIP